MTIKEAYDVVFDGKDSLYNVGVEIFKNGDFWGSCLANEIFPENGDTIVIKVRAKRSQDGRLICTDGETIFACNVMEVMGDGCTDESAKVLIRFVDADNGEVFEEFEPCYAWENTEREEVTFTVKINKGIEQEIQTPGKSEADSDKFGKLLETTSKVYGEALRRLAEGEPGDC